MFQTAFMGDVILLTGLLRAVKRAFPRAELIAVVLPECAELVSGWPDRTFTVAKHSDQAAQEWIQLYNDLHQIKFAAALIPHRSLRSARFIKSLEIPVRIGFTRGSGQWFHTHRVAYTQNLYEGARNLNLLRLLTQTDDSGLPELKIPTECLERANQVLHELSLGNKPFAVLAPGSIWKTKRWPIEHFRSLASTLRITYGLSSIVVGGKKDCELGATLAASGCYDLVGKLNLMETAALMKRAKIVISGDSAPAHLATAVGVNQSVIFGSTSPRLGFMPQTPSARALGLEMWCRPCTDHGRNSCPRSAEIPCLDQITPETVIEKLEDWLTNRA